MIYIFNFRLDFRNWKSGFKCHVMTSSSCDSSMDDSNRKIATLPLKVHLLIRSLTRYVQNVQTQLRQMSMLLCKIDTVEQTDKNDTKMLANVS